MPQPYSYNSCGYALVFSGPATVDEYDRASGEVGSCLKDAVTYTIPRYTLPEWQDQMAKEIETLTKIPRGVDEKETAKARSRSKNPDRVPAVPEKFKSYNLRVRATLAERENSEELLAQLDTLAQEVANRIPVDLTPAQRVVTIPKDCYVKADSWLEDLDTDTREGKISKFSEFVGGFDLQRDENSDPTRESLAKLIYQWQLAKLESEE